MKNSYDSSQEPEYMQFTRHQYRTALGIISEILQACADAGAYGIGVSKISEKANLSHGATTYNCQKLIDAEMAKASKSNGKHIITITEKGIGFLHELKMFHERLREINIRY